MIRTKHLILVTVLMTGTALWAQNNLNVTLDGNLTYNTFLNDVWGYADGDGNEYALVGVGNGFSVVDVTNPSSPVEEFFIPGVTSTWRDIKTWDHYAYVMHDNPQNLAFGNGLLIVDLDSIANPHYKFIYPQFIVNDNVVDSATRSHNLWVDENGFLYIFGADVGLGGALIMDVATDPWNPTYVGIYNSAYVHDGYVRNDTLWAAALNNGLLVSDVSVKSQPQFIAQFSTPNNFAHNCWLSDDGNTLFTTDEVQAGYIGSFDVSDLSNVSEIDRIQIQPNNNTIPHNAHVLGDFVVTSYYTYGLHILDAIDPGWVIEVGNYDTSPFSGAGFDGAWGAYPYLPSGVCLVTDIQQGLFTLTPNYMAAARIYGNVSDSISGTPLPNAKVYLKGDMDSVSLDANADFRRHKIGDFTDTIVITATNYRDLEVPFVYTEGNLDTVNFKLLPIDFSVEEGILSGLSLFPNPSRGDVVLRSTQSLDQAHIRIVDLSGKEVFRSEWEASTPELQLSLDLKSGIYMIEVRTKSNYWTEKLVIE